MTVLNKTETRVMDALGVTIEVMQKHKYDAIASQLPMGKLDALIMMDVKPLEHLAKAHAKLNRKVMNGYQENKYHYVKGKSKVGIFSIKLDGSVAKYGDWISRHMYEALTSGSCNTPKVDAMPDYVSKRDA